MSWKRLDESRTTKATRVKPKVIKADSLSFAVKRVCGVAQIKSGNLKLLYRHGSGAIEESKVKRIRHFWSNVHRVLV